MTNLLVLFAVAMFILCVAKEGKQQKKVDVRVQTWEEFARCHHIDIDDRLR